jgi:hypothetical protein
MLPPLKLIKEIKMILELFVIWLSLTFIMFYCCRQHNKGVTIDFIKATWEPYLFSVGVGALLALNLV